MTAPTTMTVRYDQRIAGVDLWRRWEHADIPADGGSGAPGGYDWTAIPSGFGTAYDSVGGTGGYIPDDSKSGVPSGTTFTTTVPGSSGYLTVTGAAATKGTGTATASTDVVTLAGHGLVGGMPVYFSALTGGSGLATGAANWYVVTTPTTNTFKLAKLNTATGLFAPVDITGDYTTATVVAGTWYDSTLFQCHITSNSTAAGVLLLTRSAVHGPGTAIDPASSSAAQGLVRNVSPNLIVIIADTDLIPDAPINKLDAWYGSNILRFRVKQHKNIDGGGSFGGNRGYGTYGGGAAWIWPDTVGGHSDGTHDDTAMQIFGGDIHTELGSHFEGTVDASASSTTDPTGHPIPGTSGTFNGTNSVLQVNHAAGYAVPTGLDFNKCLLGGGGFTVNVAGTDDYPSLGHVRNCRFKRTGRYANVSGIGAPSSPAKAGGATIHLDTSGNVWDDDGTTMAPYVGKGSDGAASTLVWP